MQLLNFYEKSMEMAVNALLAGDKHYFVQLGQTERKAQHARSLFRLVK
jgi:hypothetical protein